MRTRHLPGQPVLTVLPSFSAQCVAPDSPAYQEAQRLRGQRFERASKPGGRRLSSPKPPSDATFQVVIRRQAASRTPDPIVATAALELASVGTIQTMVRFAPGSRSAHILEQGAFMLLRGVALAFDVDQGAIPDIFDTLGQSILQLAAPQQIDWLWVVPRRPIVALARAEIGGVLPPYHFTPCADVIGWMPEGEGVQEIRQLELKELATDEASLPPLFEISLAQLADDLTHRLALLDQRQQTSQLARLLWEAARQANKQVIVELSRLNQLKTVAENHPQNRQETDMALFSTDDKKKKPDPLPAPRLPTAPLPAPERVPEPATPSNHRPTFLPVAGSSADEAAYLRQVVEQGGADAQRYKTVSYEWMHLEPGLQVLDVGCGIGLDLPALADRVGAAGLVIGLDHNPDLVQQATANLAERGTIRVVIAEAERLPFPHRSFDRVRADRVLQHIPDLKQVVAEMGRVLQPGGIVTIVEPDWKMVALHPGSPAGGDDDHTLQAVLAYKQRVSPHALIGRQLSSLFRQPGETLWEDLRVQAEVFTFTSWPVVDAGLLLSGMAEALAKAEPTLADEIAVWLKAIATAAERGEFLASMQLFYASARKGAPKH